MSEVEELRWQVIEEADEVRSWLDEGELKEAAEHLEHLRDVALRLADLAADAPPPENPRAPRWDHGWEGK